MFMGGVTYKIYKHEQWQSNTINQLTSDIARVNAKLEVLEENRKTHKFTEENYNYLAIGNSITLHGLAPYWWNENGMAASKTENDYFHLVKSYLETHTSEIKREVDAVALNYYQFEVMSHDRQETYSLIDSYLSKNLNLVTVQLSENVGADGLKTFVQDFEDLLLHIKEKSPHAQIIVIDDIWSDEKGLIKEQIANKLNLAFISLKKIKNNQEYLCGIGTKVYGLDGKEHIVEHDGVAKHPGDKGMQYIADGIISKLELTCE